jgi:CBS domain-containing protein
MLNALIVVLHDISRLPDLLGAWKRIGVPGVTILQSVGGFTAEKHVQRSGLGVMLNLFDQIKSQQRVVFSLIDVPELLEQAIAEADRVVKGFDRPRSGILFTIPIDKALGLQKWDKGIQDELDISEISISKDKSNLVKWFEDDLMNILDTNKLHDWSGQRKKSISEIIEDTKYELTVVHMDTPLLKVHDTLIKNPQLPIVCVVNSEERLMGVIEIPILADILLIPVMPEKYINDPEGYEKALQYAAKYKKYLAVDIMEDPMSVTLNDTLEVAFHSMKTSGQNGIIVVDTSYHVKGYLTMLDLISICYREITSEYQDYQ